MTPSILETNRPETKKPVLEPELERQVKQPTTNWLELPLDVTANILYRVGVIDILDNVQKVCTTWYKICKDPAMWRVIEMKNIWCPCARPQLERMCLCAVNRSEGQLVDISIEDFVSGELILAIADRSSQLKRIVVACCYGAHEMLYAWPKALKKFRLLEELSFYNADCSKRIIEAARRYCPLLKTLKVNHSAYMQSDLVSEDEKETIYNLMAISIGENLPGLRHLELIKDDMSNIGLQVILDGCRHLESPDLRGCLNIDLEGVLGKRLSQQIKNLKLPKDSLEDFPCRCMVDDDTDDMSPQSLYFESSGFYDDEDEDDSNDGDSDDPTYRCSHENIIQKNS